MLPFSRNIRFAGVLLALLAALLLSACGGGGGGGSSSSGPTLSGTAATGAPVSGFVYVTDSNGVEVNAPINEDGSFSVSVAGMTAPFILRAIPDDCPDCVLFSFASSSDITVNITPLTTLSLHLASGGSLADLYAAWSANFDALDDASITDIQSVINANFAELFGTFGVDATFYDFMHAEFNADGTGIDGVLDMLTISLDYNGETFTVAIDGESYSWNPEIDTSGINIGDFAIPESSTWQLSISDPGNNIDFTDVVTGPFVPNSLDDFEEITGEQLYGELVIEGLEVTFDISNFSLDVVGNGEVGTLIIGQFTGSITLNGEIEGQVFDNVTYNFDTTFVWERLADL